MSLRIETKRESSLLQKVPMEIFTSSEEKLIKA
jgi:hypothetical protein